MSEETGQITVPGSDAHLVQGSGDRGRLLDLAKSADRRRALLADPSLAASHLPREEFSDKEVEDLKQAVLQVRRLRKVELARDVPVSRRLSGLAIAMTLCLLFLLPSSLRRVPETAMTAPPSDSPVAPTAMTHSSVEALGLPGARVYELADEDFSLVLVVDESFEL